MNKIKLTVFAPAVFLFSFMICSGVDRGLTGFWVYEDEDSSLFFKIALLEGKEGHLSYSGIEGGSARTLAINGKGLKVAGYISLYGNFKTISTSVGVIKDENTIIFESWKSNQPRPFVLKRFMGSAVEAFDMDIKSLFEAD